MSRVVFLLEEYSMKILLEALIPRLVPSLPFLCVPHEGKQDLEKSIPRKLRAWREPGVRFVDAQEQGPFALWEHEHRFEILDGRVHMLDRVRYRLPLGALGRAVGGLPVRVALDAIFDYRYHAIARSFSAKELA